MMMTSSPPLDRDCTIKRDQRDPSSSSGSSSDTSDDAPRLKKFKSMAPTPVPAALGLLSMAHSSPRTTQREDSFDEDSDEHHNRGKTTAAVTEDEKRTNVETSLSESGSSDGQARAKRAAAAASIHVKPLELLVQPGGGRIRFPDKLMAYLLKSAAENKVLWWLPDGSAFAFDSERIHTEFLDLYFRGTKLTSFIRSLNRWGFRRVFYHSLPKNTLSFHHPLFQRDDPGLVPGIRMVTYNPRDAKEDTNINAVPSDQRSDGSSSSHPSSPGANVPGFVRGPFSPHRPSSSDAGSLTGSHSGSAENARLAAPQQPSSPVLQLLQQQSPRMQLVQAASPPRTPQPAQGQTAGSTSNPALETLVQQLVRGQQQQQPRRLPQNLNAVLQALAAQQQHQHQAPPVQQPQSDNRQAILQTVLGLMHHQQQPQPVPAVAQRREDPPPANSLLQLLQQPQQPQQQQAILQLLLQQQQNLQATAQAPAANANLQQLVEAAMTVERDRQALRKATDQLAQSQQRYQTVFQQWQASVQSSKPN